MKQTINDLQNLKGKVVFLRVDFNVPIQNRKVTDVTRINSSLETISALLKEEAKVVLLSHLGRVKSEEDKKKNDMKIVADKFREISGIELKYSPETRGEAFETAINELQDGELLLIQNTRYEDFVNGEQVNNESGNSDELASYWAQFADVYVNDAFGMAHREHASNFGLSTYVKENAIGKLIEKEIEQLGALLKPEHPFVAIMSGAKVSDKIKLIDKLITKADTIITAGGIGYTLAASTGLEVGQSLQEAKFYDYSRKLMNTGKVKFPVDFNCSKEFADTTPVYFETEITDPEFEGLDIGHKTIEMYKEILSTAKTVLWNGPLGVSEFNNYEKGTLEIGKFLAELDAVTIIGGGDSAAAMVKLGLADKFTHISTGGGATLVYLETNGVLPALKNMKEK